MPKISINDALTLKDVVFLDVRSEKEFEEDHIPGAINMPILNNEERHIVGYTYKQESKDKAYEIGYKIFDQKISEFENLLRNYKDKEIIFYCFRGGMRSGCFVDYFLKKGLKVYQIEGGYKKYRELVRDEIKKAILPEKIIVIYGLTGSGKTEIIKKLENAIDLEGLAKHRSSLFGGVGLKPNTQKMFETLLFNELKKNRDYLILEGESRKIGSIILPENVYNAMINAKKLAVTCSIESRARRIVKDYFTNQEKIDEVKAIVPKLTERLSKKKVDELLTLLENKNYFEFSKIMLKEYYDPLYTHYVKDFKFEKEVSSEDIDEAVKIIDEFCKNIE